MAANNEKANVDQDQVKSDDKITSSDQPSDQQKTGDLTSFVEQSAVFGASGLFGHSKLHSAASNGQDAVLNSLLAENPDGVNSKTVDGGYTPLHLAASAGHVECVKELLEYHKTDIHVTDAFGRTPLEIAEQYFRTTVATLLRSSGIIKAAREEKGNYLDILLKTLTDPSSLIDRCYDVALMAAVENNRCSNAEKLILAGAANIDDALESTKQVEIKLMLLMVKAVLEGDHQLIAEIKRISGNKFNENKTLSGGSGETLPHSADDEARNLIYTILYSEEMIKHINNGGRIRTRVPIKLAMNHEKSSTILDDLLSITNINLGTGSVGWSDLNLSEVNINWIRNLPKHMIIKQLNLSHNRLSTLRINVASYLNRCTKLELHYNNIKAIPKSILELPSIKELNVSHNKVSALPNVSWSASLAQLNLSHNELETLPDGVTERCAGSMKVLQLDHNHLREVPNCVCFLCNLNILDISDNPDILVLPVGLGRLKELTQLNLNGLHNLQDPPSSICENFATCLSYLKSQLLKQSRYYRMKLMLVGKQNVGKTTMVGCLQGRQYPEGSTIGVDIGDWSYRLSMFKQSFSFSVWDFARQEEYYATHQVFLSKRSLYLAVWNVLDERKGIEELRPWLNNIILRAPESRIIIVGTHFDKLISELGSREQANAQCDEYQKQLSQIIEHSYFETDVVKVMFVGLKGRLINVSTLKDEIYKTAEQCTDDGRLVMGCNIPTSYNKVDNLLKSSKVLEPILHATQFKNMVRSLNQPDLQSEDEIRAVTLFLHDIGSLLHFDDHRHNLDDLYFVKPQWLCKLMSTVITVKKRNDYVKDGRIAKQDLEKLFQNADLNAYPEQYLEQYLAIFNRFEIALPLNKEGNLLLIPCFLSPKIPEMVDDLRANCCYQRMFGFQDVTTPPGLWSRLLSRLMNSVTDVKNYLIQDCEEERGLLYWKKGLCWHSGDALFIIESCQLQAEDDGISITYSSSVTTYSSNVAQEGLLGQLVNIVQQIVREWFPGLVKRLEQMFICYECAKNNRQTIFQLPQLLDCVAESETFIKCGVCQEDIDLKLLAPDILLHDMDCVLKFESVQIQYDEALIWCGKFGKVYHAKLDSGIPVIVKLYDTSKDSRIEDYEALIQIFQAEVTYLQRIKHPCLVGMVGVCKYPNVALVMEDCPVGSLDSYVLKELHNVSRIVVFRIAAQVASALHFLHSIPVIYRGLSADKVLIWSLSLDDMVNCKLAGLEIATYEDFGYVKSFFADKQVAPEVSKQAIYDKRVDIYSLGVLFLHMMQRSYPTQYRTEVETPLISKFISVPDSELRHIGNLAKSCCSHDPADRPELEEIMTRLCDPIFQLMMHVTMITLDGIIVCTCTVEASAASSYCTTEAWMCCTYNNKSEIIVFLLNGITLELEKRYCIEDHEINTMLSCGRYVWATSIQAGRKGSLLKFDSDKKDEYVKVPIKCRGGESAVNLPSDDYGVSLACSDSYVYVGTAGGWCLVYSTNISENPVPIREVKLSGIRSMVVVKKTSLLWVSTRVSTGSSTEDHDQILFVDLNSFQDRKEVNINNYRVGKLLLSPDEEIMWTVHVNGHSISAWNTQKQKLICLFKLHELLGEEVDQQEIRITTASATLDTLWVGLHSGHILVLCAALPQKALIVTKPFDQNVEILVPVYGKDNNITMISIGKDYQLEKQSGVQKHKSLDVVLWEVVSARHMLQMNCLSTGKAWLDDASLNEVMNSISDAQKQLQLEKQPMGWETQSETTEQAESATKQKIQQSDLEYKLFMQYYSKLSDVLSLVDLTSHFVAANIITSSDAETITNTITESQTAILQNLLNTISLAFSLGNDGSKLFDKMLEIMQMYGDDIVQQLAADMSETIVKQRSAVPTTSEKQQVIQETLQAQSAIQELSDVPSLVDLTSHFVAANIITSSDAEAVTNTITTESQTTALRELLNKISLAFSLGHYDSELLDKLLKIMEMYGDDIVQQLVADMLETIVKQRSAASATSGEEVDLNSNLVPPSSATFDHEEMIIEEHVPELAISSDEEVHLISNLVPVVSKTFDHHGGEMFIEEHDVTITVPELAISEGDKVEFQAIVSLTGPYQLPDGYDLVSVFVWIEADYKFRKLVKIMIPHFASIENLDQRFDVVVLTANEKDLVVNENGDSLLQLHESVYDYQYEVNDDYCDYYTDHFCSKCLARRRSFIFRLFDRLTLPSPGVVPNPSRTRITVFFCVPDDYVTADDLLIELCICYSLKHCLQTVRKSYEQRKMLSRKSSNVPWTIAIDNEKCQNFCLTCGECPGWKIEPIGLEKFSRDERPIAMACFDRLLQVTSQFSYADRDSCTVSSSASDVVLSNTVVTVIKVSDLDFHTYSNLEDLRAEEDLCMYPPRFKVSVVRLAHGKQLDTEFNIVLENNGVLVSHEIRKFPLTVVKLDIRGYMNQPFISKHVDPTLPSISNTAITTTTTTTPTTTTTICSSSTTDISLASYHSSSSATDDLSPTTIAPVASTASTTDTGLVTNQTTLAHLPVSPTTPGNTFVKQNVIVQAIGGINIYQTESKPHLGVEQSRGSFNSLECLASDITGRIDLTVILPYLVSYRLLTPEQQDYLTHSAYTSSNKIQKLCNILLRLDESNIKKFLQCLSETSDYDPHKQLLEKIQSKMKEATVSDDDGDDAPI